MPRVRRANIGRRTRHASQQQVYLQNLSEERQYIIRENARLRQRMSTRRSLASYNRLAIQNSKDHEITPETQVHSSDNRDLTSNGRFNAQNDIDEDQTANERFKRNPNQISHADAKDSAKASGASSGTASAKASDVASAKTSGTASAKASAKASAGVSAS